MDNLSAESQSRRPDPSTDLEAVRREIEQEREKLDRERREAAERWEKKLTELEQLQGELTSERQALRAERDAWTAKQQQTPTADESQEPATTLSDSSRQADDSTSEACEDEEEESQGLRRSVRSAREEEEEDEESASETPSPARSAARASRPAEPVAASGDEEESIEDYMAALLTRMRGGSGPSQVAVAQPTPRKRSQRQEARAPEPAKVEAPCPASQAQAEPSAPAVVPPVATELVRRTVSVPATDLSAMRELANAQARMAIHRHSRKEVANTVLLRAGGAGICLILGFVAMRMGSHGEQLLAGAAMACIVAGIYLLNHAAKDLQVFLNWYDTIGAGLPEDGQVIDPAVVPVGEETAAAEGEPALCATDAGQGDA